MNKDEMRKVYDDYRHYGEIVDRHDVDFTKLGGNYVSLIKIKLNESTKLFWMCNGEVVDIEDIKSHS